jgi:serine/threonine-protein kinase
MDALINHRFQLGEEITRGESAGGAGEEAPGNLSRLNPKNDEARTYRAQDLESGKTVMVKILTHAASKASGFRSRFQRDAAILRSFDHPNVVRTIDSGITAEGQPYLALEFQEGQLLASKIAGQGPISPEEMGLYLQQIASALDAAHARGIIHRDINPSAILISSEPAETPTVKLLNFALAKENARPGASQLEFTSKQTSLGIAAYLSPEQARGGEVDGRSDVYALGVTLYESLTGRLPFEGETDFQILLAQLNGSIQPFPEGWSDLENAQAIEAVVLKALAKDPADRPATAGILSALFQEALLTRPSSKLAFTWPLLAGGVILITSLVFLANWLL